MATTYKEPIKVLTKVKNKSKQLLYLYYDKYNKRWCNKNYFGTLTTHPQDGHSGTFYVVQSKNKGDNDDNSQ